MSGYLSHRNRSFSPIARRSSKRLRLDSSPSSFHNMSFQENTSQESSISHSITTTAIFSTFGYQQSATTSPACSLEPISPGRFHRLSGSGAGPSSTEACNTLSEERYVATCLPPSLIASSSSDASAATYHVSTANFHLYPNPPQTPISTIHGQPQSYFSTKQNISTPTPTSIPRDDSGSNASDSEEGILAPQPLFNLLASEFTRDAILLHAYRFCSKASLPPNLSFMPTLHGGNENTSCGNISHTAELLPILHALRTYHPTHIPVITLLGCVLHSIGDYNGCIEINLKILQLDHNYVEAMSNIGTALCSIGRYQEAEAWWWKAIRIQPLFWDAIDNILGILCNPVYTTESPRFQDAVRVCEFVESRVLNDNGEFLIDVPLSQRHRIQSLLYTHGNLLLSIGSGNASDSAVSFLLKGLDLAVRPFNSMTDKTSSYRSFDVIVAVCVAGLFAGASPDNHLSSELARVLGLSSPLMSRVELLSPRFDVLQTVYNAGPRLIEVLLRMGSGSFPMTLLLPDQASRLLLLLFPSYSGNLPGLFSSTDSSSHSHVDASPALKMTTTILLSLARIFQSGSNANQQLLTIKGVTVRSSTSFVLLLYYLAAAIYPSPAICNNIGIILSTIPLSTVLKDGENLFESVNGQHIAKAYYTKGLTQDSTHPHLLTNLGSLLKDQGKLEDAIRTYAQVLQLKPDFDVALANMGNVVKDLGRPHEAISFYQRALEANPNFQEAICGLASAQGAVCDWRGRGGISGELQLDEHGRLSDSPREGWINKVIQICDQQLLAGYSYGAGVMQLHSTLKQWLGTLETAYGRPFCRSQKKRWTKMLQRFFTSFDRPGKRVNEGGMIIRLIEFIIRVTQRRWYIDAYGRRAYTGDEPAVTPVSLRMHEFELQKYKRLKICAMGPPPVPSVLPFHTFTYPLSPRTIRLVSYRNALRISYTTQTQSWLPSHVYPPPAPLKDKLKIGYVSNDLNNHPLAHLMQSVFGLHDKTRFEVYVYATSRSDGSEYRRKIETESQHFLDVSCLSTKSIVEHIVMDGIHILINLGGYTKGARNDIFAARPAPIQLQLMGFAGTLAAEWCDYLVSDVISTPPETCAWERWRKEKELEETCRERGSLSADADADAGLDPESLSDEWMYTEHMIYMPHTFFVTDHKQSSNPGATKNLSSEEMWKEEANSRAQMRKEIFPHLSHKTFIFANFNQLYKIDPTIFATWVKILQIVPNGVLWLLRFPSEGEEHLKRTAAFWANSEVASRILFTDVVSKEEHLRRIRLADLVLDTVECNAHTIAADVLWAGTPIITWPKYKSKMCSRVAASIAMATNLGEKMVVDSLQEYENRAVYYARSVQWCQEDAEDQRATGELIDLHKALFLSRENVPLFDTAQWTRDVEKGFTEAWRRWIAGTCFEEISEEWERSDGSEKISGSIWVKDLEVAPC